MEKRGECGGEDRHQLCLKSDLKKNPHRVNQPELPHRGGCLQTASSPIAQLSKNKTCTPTVFRRADKIAIPLLVACLPFSASSQFAPAVQRWAVGKRNPHACTAVEGCFFSLFGLREYFPLFLNCDSHCLWWPRLTPSKLRQYPGVVFITT